VRKVLAVVALKGLEYEIDPITPFYGGDEFERLSPLRRIPVLVDGDFALCDSSAIAAYLDEKHPEPTLLPPDLRDRALARWLEEYADSRLGDVFIWGLFYPKIVHPIVWGEAGDPARIKKTLREDVPREMDWLEAQLPDDGFLFGEAIGLADISIASFFRNAAFAGFEPDPARWPRVAGFVERALGQDCFARFLPFERAQLGTDPQGRRKALLEAGAPLAAETLGTREPRRGVMRL
jgi:glutathione S-transferase